MKNYQKPESYKYKKGIRDYTEKLDDGWPMLLSFKNLKEVKQRLRFSRIYVLSGYRVVSFLDKSYTEPEGDIHYLQFIIATSWSGKYQYCKNTLSFSCINKILDAFNEGNYDNELWQYFIENRQENPVRLHRG